MYDVTSVESSLSLPDLTNLTSRLTAAAFESGSLESVFHTTVAVSSLLNTMNSTSEIVALRTSMLGSIADASDGVDVSLDTLNQQATSLLALTDRPSQLEDAAQETALEYTRNLAASSRSLVTAKHARGYLEDRYSPGLGGRTVVRARGVLRVFDEHA